MSIPVSMIKFYRNKNNASYKVKYAISYSERRELIKEVKCAGLCVFEYYLRLASIEHTPIDDQETAEYFGWQKVTAKKHRLALVKAGWVYIEKGNFPGNRRMQVVHLGKDEVADAKSQIPFRPLVGPHAENG